MMPLYIVKWPIIDTIDTQWLHCWTVLIYFDFYRFPNHILYETESGLLKR